MNNPTLVELHKRRTGKVSDKWELYLSVYENLFERYRLQNGSLLEIGVQNGGSIETWCEYFKSFEVIVGCDIDPKCNLLSYNDPRVNIVIGNVTEPSVIQRINLLRNKWTLIIDDGSHLPFDVIKAFLLLFPSLEPGGTYVIEDTHVFYGGVPGGGVLNPGSIQDVFKRLTDCINRQFWDHEVDWRLLFHGLFPQKSSVPQVLSGSWIRSVSFFNSMIVIEKERVEAVNKLGARLRTGTQMLVQDWSGKQA